MQSNQMFRLLMMTANRAGSAGASEPQCKYLASLAFTAGDEIGDIFDNWQNRHMTAKDASMMIGHYLAARKATG